jgi:hypothetical protein
MARSSLALARAILGRPEANDGEWNETENGTLVSLSQYLYQPSPTLARKYSSPHLSRASQRLADFMAHQAAMARRANPPSPPSEPIVKHSNIYSTPQKSHTAALGFDGYLTPPITPDGVQYGNQMAKDSYMPPRCPVTPTPHQNIPNAYPQHVQQYNGYVNNHGVIQ